MPGCHLLALADAKAAFSRAVQLDANDADLLGNLGAILAAMDRNAEAAKPLERSLEIAPNNDGVKQKLEQLRRK